jgi:hypothetical protein
MVGKNDLAMQPSHEARHGETFEQGDLRHILWLEQREIGALDIVPCHFAVTPQSVETRAARDGQNLVDKVGMLGAHETLLWLISEQ